jgi:hypothetical protein
MTLQCSTGLTFLFDLVQATSRMLYLENGHILNEEIIKAGYASPMTIPPM